MNHKKSFYNSDKLNTGSVKIQILLLSNNIQKITRHLKIHKKDLHSKRGLIQTISIRKKMIKYNNRKRINI